MLDVVGYSRHVSADEADERLTTHVVLSSLVFGTFRTWRMRFKAEVNESNIAALRK